MSPCFFEIRLPFVGRAELKSHRKGMKIWQGLQSHDEQFALDPKILKAAVPARATDDNMG